MIFCILLFCSCSSIDCAEGHWQSTCNRHCVTNKVVMQETRRSIGLVQAQARGSCMKQDQAGGCCTAQAVGGSGLKECWGTRLTCWLVLSRRVWTYRSMLLSIVAASQPALYSTHCSLPNPLLTLYINFAPLPLPFPFPLPLPSPLPLPLPLPLLLPLPLPLPLLLPPLLVLCSCFSHAGEYNACLCSQAATLLLACSHFLLTSCSDCGMTVCTEAREVSTEI